MKFKKLPASRLAAIISSLMLSNLAHAQSPVKLEEVVVTANKRQESKSEVTTSVSVLDGTYLEKMNVNKLEDIVNLTDNLHFTESGLSTQFRIRGIGSGNSQGFEQSVVQYVDGVHYGRAQLFRAPLYDLESVEVLRGSLNSIFGKDSIGGGIAINTAPATADFGGKIGIGYNPQFDRYEESFILNGPLSDSLNARLALHGLQDDGFYDNTTKGKSGAERKEQFARLKLDWQVSENFNLRTKLETGSFNLKGRPFEITQDLPSPLTLDLIARQPGNAALQGIPSTFNNIMTVLVGQQPFESEADWKRQSNSPEVSRNHVNNITIDAAYDYGDIQWNTKVAHVNYGYDELCDCDYTPANIFTLTLNEHYEQTSFDTYLRNEADSGVRWLAGAYLQDSDLQFNDRFYVPTDSVLGPLGNPLPGSGVDRDFAQKGATAAVYGELTYPILESTELTVGGRYTYDEKEGQRQLTIVDGDNNAIDSVALACAYLYGVKVDTVQSLGLPYDCGAAQPDLSKGVSPGHTLDAERDESSFTPFLTVKHFFTETDSAFVSIKKGHKSGGFDPRSNSPASFEFNEESALTAELGLRSVSDDGRFENGITFFRTTYDDLQVSQYDGALGFNVGNAKETTSQGFEFDGRAALLDGLILSYSAGYVDIEYKDFENGNCYQGQTPNGSDMNGDGVPDLCDYSGLSPAFAPSKTANLGIDYTFAAFQGLLSSSLNAQYVGEHNVHENLDPNSTQESYVMLNASVSYEVGNIGLHVAANNLTDEYVKTYQANVPLSGTQFGTNTLYTFAKPPRSFTATVSYRF